MLREDPELASALEEREVGGLGIFFIRQFVDAVYYRREDDQKILVIAMNMDEQR